MTACLTKPVKRSIRGEYKQQNLFSYTNYDTRQWTPSFACGGSLPVFSAHQFNIIN